MRDAIHMSRRQFIRRGTLAGGGLVLGFSLPRENPFSEAATSSKAARLNGFVQIAPDDAVTLIVNKSEMGQGVYTSLPMLIAEELECDWSKIRVEAAPVDPLYNHTQWGIQGTGGSTSVWSEWDRMRSVGAAARMMLVTAAAELWKVSPSSCKAEKGFVIHVPTKRKRSFGSLAERASRLEVPKDVPLKQPKEFKLIGKERKRLDTPEKTNGKALFGMDMKIPGMLIALIERSPVFGGKVKRFNADKAKAVPGVEAVVQIGSGVAVVATGFYPARLGREALEIDWDEGPLANFSTSGLRETYTALAKTAGTVARKEGESPSKAPSKAAKQLTAEYGVPYLAHACMEPLNCVVDLRNDFCEIWTGTQFQTADRNAAAREAGLRPEQVQIHTLFLGGGFGRRANPQSDFVVEAVQVAKAIQGPVKVIWTREDDTKGGYYRPMWHDRLAAELDESGNPVSWQHTIVGQSILTGTPFGQMVKNGIDPASVEGAKEIPYEIPGVLVELHSTEIGIPVLWWRSVGHSHTAFVVESFIDEAAVAAGKDPYLYRRGLLAKHPRHLGALDLAAQKADWGKPLPKGWGRGIAVHESFGSFVSQVAEVSISSAGEVKVHRVVCAVDCGRTVNPLTIKAQMESGIAYGLSAALHGEITLKNGRVEQENFNDYPVLRLNEMPSVQVEIVSSQEKAGGVGEPGVPPIAPAVCNAIFAVTGKRIRNLPIRSEELKET